MLMTERISGEGKKAHRKLREVVSFSLWKGKSKVRNPRSNYKEI